jgi:hypothetical protein
MAEITEPGLEEKPLDPVEARQIREKEVLFLRHQIQKAFLSRGEAPQEKQMPLMVVYFQRLEGYADLDVDVIRITKIDKALRLLNKLNTIPRDDEFQFRRRSTELLSRWDSLLNHDPTSTKTMDPDKTTNRVQNQQSTVMIEEGQKPDTRAEKTVKTTMEPPVINSKTEKPVKTVQPSCLVIEKLESKESTPEAAPQGQRGSRRRTHGEKAQQQTFPTTEISVKAVFAYIDERFTSNPVALPSTSSSSLPTTETRPFPRSKQLKQLPQRESHHSRTKESTTNPSPAVVPQGEDTQYTLHEGSPKTSKRAKRYPPNHSRVSHTSAQCTRASNRNPSAQALAALDKQPYRPKLPSSTRSTIRPTRQSRRMVQEQQSTAEENGDVTPHDDMNGPKEPRDSTVNEIASSTEPSGFDSLLAASKFLAKDERLAEATYRIDMISD